ncbi:hypothetical protein Tco_1135218 [Tanacetum coccineum]
MGWWGVGWGFLCGGWVAGRCFFGVGWGGGGLLEGWGSGVLGGINSRLSGDSLLRFDPDKMADENVPAPAPTRSDDQILPFAAWVPIRKSNHVLDLQKRQKNPIFQIAVDILQNTNFFRAFTTSGSVPAIYIQQFWNMLTYVEKAGTYRF